MQTSLKGVLQQLCDSTLYLYEGKVTSTEPLELQLVDDENVVMTEDSLIKAAEKEVHKGEIWYLLPVNGEQFYILDKME